MEKQEPEVIWGGQFACCRTRVLSKGATSFSWGDSAAFDNLGPTYLQDRADDSPVLLLPLRQWFLCCFPPLFSMSSGLSWSSPNSLRPVSSIVVWKCTANWTLENCFYFATSPTHNPLGASHWLEHRAAAILALHGWKKAQVCFCRGTSSLEPVAAPWSQARKPWTWEPTWVKTGEDVYKSEKVSISLQLSSFES